MNSVDMMTPVYLIRKSLSVSGSYIASCKAVPHKSAKIRHQEAMIPNKPVDVFLNSFPKQLLFSGAEGVAFYAVKHKSSKKKMTLNLTFY